MFELTEASKPSSCSMTDQEFISRLTLKGSPVGSICFELELGWIRDLVGLIWYASSAIACPDAEDSLIYPLGQVDSPGDLDPFAWELYADEIQGFKCNVDAGWMKHRDELFNVVGKPLGRLSMANYQKHMKGTSNANRRKSSKDGDSQLLIELDRRRQDYICDEVFGRYVEMHCQRQFDESTLCLACWQPQAFLALVAELLPSTGVRLPLSRGQVVGYERDLEVSTMFLEVNPFAGYHMYPATLPSGANPFAY